MKLKRIIFVGLAAGALALTACAGGNGGGAGRFGVDMRASAYKPSAFAFSAS